MSFFAVIFKIIPYLMPFIKEMLIGKKSWKQAFKENRGKTILAVAVTISVAFNVVLMTKVGTLAFKYLELSRAKQELEMKYHVSDHNTDPIASSAKHPVTNNTEQVAEVKKTEPPKPPVLVAKGSTTVKPEPDLAAEVKAEYERIRQREAAAEH